MAQQIASLYARIGADVSGLTKGLATAKDKLQGAGKAMMSVGAKLTMGVTTPIVGMGIAALKGAIDVESAFAGVIKTTDGLTDKYGELNDTGQDLKRGFQDLALSIPVDVADLMGIGELGGQLGISRENLLEFTETMAALGVSTNMTGEQAATALAQIANVMGTPQEEIERMGASIVALGNNFATTESDITNFATRIAGAGEIAGLTEADVFGMAAAFSSVGIQAEAGGTAVQKVLMKMNQAVVGNTGELIDNSDKIAKNQAKLNDLNASLAIAIQKQAEFGSKTKQSSRMAAQARIDKLTRQIEDQTEALALLNAEHGTMADAGAIEVFAKTAGMAAEDFAKLWGEDAGKAFAQFVTGLGAAGDDAMGILESLDLKDQRLLRAFLSLAGAGDLITRSMDMSNDAWAENTALTTEAGQRYKTTASKLAVLKNAVTDVAVSFGDLLLPFLQQFMDLLRLAIAFVGGLTDKQKKLVLVILGIAAAAGPVLTVLGGLATVIGALASPIGLVVAGIIALGAAFVKSQGGIGGAVAKLQALWAMVSEKVQPVLAALGEFWDGLWMQLQATFGPIMQNITDKIGALASDAKDFFTTEFGVIADWVQTNMPLIQSTISIVLYKIRSVWDTVWPYLSQTLSATWEIIKTVVSTATEAVLGIIKAVMLAINGDWAGAWEEIKGVAVTLLEGIGTVVQTNLDLILGFFGTNLAAVWETIKTWATNAYESFTTWIDDTATAIETFFTGLPARFVTWLDDAKTAILGRISEWRTAGGDLIRGLIDGVGDLAEALRRKLVETASAAWQALLAFFGISSPSTLTMEAGIAIMQGLAAGLDEGEADTLSAVARMAQNIAGAFADFAGIATINFSSPPDLTGLDAWLDSLVAVTDGVMERLVDIKEVWGRWVLKAAAETADSVGKVLGILKTAMDIPDIAPDFGARLTAYLDAVLIAIDPIMERLVDIKEVWGRWVLKAAAETADSVGKVLNVLSFGQIFADMASLETGGLSTFIDGVVDAMDMAADKLVPALESIKERFGDALASARDTGDIVGDIIHTIAQAVKDSEAALNLGGFDLGGIRALFTQWQQVTNLAAQRTAAGGGLVPAPATAATGGGSFTINLLVNGEQLGSYPVRMDEAAQTDIDLATLLTQVA